MTRFPFQTAYTQARELYGLELRPDEFETLGVIAWDKIGNKEYQLYKYEITPIANTQGEWIIELPCNADIIEAVTADYEDYQKTSNQYLSANLQNGWIEDYIETRKFNTGSLYPSGKYVKYHQVGNCIKLEAEFQKITVWYKGFVADAEGLPFLSVKELDAIAVFCAYSDMFKKALVTKDGASMQFAQILEQKWKSFCTQARIPEYINQNEMDEILNVAASWDRKRFGKSFKPIH